MSNSDKNIIISPSIGSTDVKPSIQFTGAGNSTINLTVGDTNFIDFNSDNKSLFSVEHTSPNEDILVITNNYSNTSARFLSDGSTGLGLLFGTAGYVGIGTASAEEKLHVKGNLKVEGNILPSGQVINPNSKTDIKDATVTQDEFYNFYNDNKFNGNSIHTYKFSPDGTKSIVVDTSHFIHGVTNSPAYALQGSEIDSTFNIRTAGISTLYTSFVGYSAYVKDDGSAVYFSGAKNDGTRVISQFDLSINWDVSTIGFTTEYSFGKVLDSITHDAITFSADGSKLVFNGKGAYYDAIAQMDLSTPWSIDTLSGISSSYFLSQVDRVAESTILKPDGTKAYVIGRQTNDIIELDLGTPYQIGSAKYNGVSKDLGGGYYDIKFKSDGTILFAVNSGNTVYSWTLSSAWDLSTLSSSTSLNASAYDSDIEGLAFNPDGTELYLSGNSSKKIHQYTLSSAWDLSTASYTGELATGSLINNGVADSFGLYDLRGDNLGITTQKSRELRGIGISTDGTRLYVNDLWGQYITTWDLGTPWDVSTGISSTTDTLAVVGDDTGGIYFDDTGSHLYVTSQKFPLVQQYDLATPWDLKTATTDINWSSVEATFFTQSQDIIGIAFNSDGTELTAFSSYYDGNFQKFSLGTVYDVSTMAGYGSTNINKFITPSKVNQPYGYGSNGDFTWADNGKKVVVPTQYGVAKLNLEKAYDIFSIIPDYKTFGFQANDRYAHFDISPDGRNLILYSNSRYSIMYYVLSTPWDFTTRTLVKEIKTDNNGATTEFKIPYENDIRKIKYSLDGTKLYVLYGRSTYEIVVYTLQIPYNLTTLLQDRGATTKIVDIPNFPVRENHYQFIDWNGLDFSNDGKKFYIQENYTNNIYELDLSIAWNPSSAVYNGVSITSASTNNYGGIAFTRDGLKLYVGTGDKLIYQYDLLTAWDLSTATLNSNSFNIDNTYGGTYFRGLMVTTDSKKLYFYHELSYAIVCYDFVSKEYSIASDLYIGGDAHVLQNLYVSGETKLRSNLLATKVAIGATTLSDVSKKNNALGLSVFNASTMNSIGPEKDISKLVPVDNNLPDELLINKDLQPSNNDSRVFTLSDDGTKLFSVIVFQPSGARGIKSYVLSTPYDLSTATVEYIKDLEHDNDDFVHSIKFSTDGTKFYTTTDASIAIASQISFIHQYELETAWDIRSAKRTKTFYLSNQNAGHRGINFKPDGTKFYTLSGTYNVANVEINEYTLSTPWDISTATHTSALSKIYTFLTATPYMWDLYISPDGNSFWISGEVSTTNSQYNNIFTKFDMSSAWDLSTAYYSNQHEIRQSIGKNVYSFITFMFSNNGLHLYAANTTGTIRHYELGTAFDVRTLPTLPNFIYVTNFNVSSARFLEDGKFLFLSFLASDARKYPLARPYDLSSINTSNLYTSTYNNEYYDRQTVQAPYAVLFSKDGKYVYEVHHILAYSARMAIMQYELQSPFAVGSPAKNRYVFSVPSYASFVPPTVGLDAAQFSSDGKKLYISVYRNPIFLEIDVPTPWDLSSVRMKYTTHPVDDVNSMINFAFNSDGTEYYFQTDNDKLYKFYTTTPYEIDNESYNKKEIITTTVADSYLHGMFVGAASTHFYTVGYGEDNIYQWNADSTDFNDSTVIHTLDISSEFVYPKGVFFKSDGTEMYVAGDANAGGRLAQYTLSTPWHLPSAGITTVFNIADKDSNGGTNRFDNAQKITLSSDGKTAHISFYEAAESIEQFTLGTAWDLSTISYDHDNPVLISPDYQRRGFVSHEFSADGKKLYLLGNNKTSLGNLVKYNLTTAWDISTATLALPEGVRVSGTIQNLSGWGESNTIRYIVNMEFEEDGTTMYAVTSPDGYSPLEDRPYILQFNFGSPWDVTTMEFTTKYELPNTKSFADAALLWSIDKKRLYVFGDEYGTPGNFSRYYEYSLENQRNNTIVFTGEAEFSAKTLFDRGLKSDGISEFSTVGIGTTISKNRNVALTVLNGSDIDSITNDLNFNCTNIESDPLIDENTFSFVGGDKTKLIWENPINGGISDIDESMNCGISTDGINFYIAFYAGHNNRIEQYELTTPFKINTAKYPPKAIRSFYDDQVLPATNTNDYLRYEDSNFGVRRLLAFKFSPDGTKLTIAGDYAGFVGDGTISANFTNSGRKLITYSLDTAWDISSVNVGLTTFRYTEEFRSSNSEYVRYPYGINFNPDGSKIYLSDDNKVVQVGLSSAYNVGSASTSTYVRTQYGASYGNKFFFEPGGEIGWYHDTYYGLSSGLFHTPYEITSDATLHRLHDKRVKLSSIFPILDNDRSSPFYEPFDISEDGKYIYYVNRAQSLVYGTELTTPWDFSTAKSLVKNNTYIQNLIETVSSSNTEVLDWNTGARAFYITPDGLKVFATDSNTLVEFDLDEPWMLNKRGETNGTWYGDVYKAKTSERYFGIPSKYGFDGKTYTTDNYFNVYDIKFSSDGLNFYASDNTLAVINHWILEKPFNIRTATLNYSLPIGLYENPSFAFDISVDGTKLYASSGGGIYVQYDLSTPWDLRTAINEEKMLPIRTTTRIREDGTDNTETNIYSMEFNDDGSKLFVLDFRREEIFEWSLSSPYNINTAKRTVNKLNISAQTSNNAFKIRFKPNGTELYVVDDTNNEIYQYTLSIGFDLTTASYTRTLSSPVTNVRNILFKPDGTKIYFYDSNGADQRIHQYTLSTPWDISSATTDSKFWEFYSTFGEGTTSSTTSSAVYTFLNSGIRFSSDGKFIYCVESNRIAKYPLRVAWDISTIYLSSNSAESSVVGNTGVRFLDFSTISGNPNNLTYDIAFNNDESKLYTLHTYDSTGTVIYAEDYIFEYSMSTPGDLYTLYREKPKNLLNSGKFFGATQTTIYSIKFTPDGRKLFIAQHGSEILEFTLKTPWEIGTATYSNALDSRSYFGSPLINPNGLFIRPNGSELWVNYNTEAYFVRWNLTTKKPLDILKDVNLFGDISIHGSIDVYGRANINKSRIINLESGDPKVGIKGEVSLKVHNTLSVDRIADEIKDNLDFSLDGSLILTNTSLSNRERLRNSINQSGLSTVTDSTFWGVHPNETRGVSFSNNGKYVYSVGFDEYNSFLYKFELDAPYELSNNKTKSMEIIDLGSVKNAPINGKYPRYNNSGSAPKTVFVDDLGKNIFVCGDTGIGTAGVVNQYVLSTPNDLSTLGFSTNFDASSTISNVTTISIGNSGTALYLGGESNATTYQFVLSTPYDVSTASLTTSFSENASWRTRGIGFSTGGDYVYYVNQSSETIKFELTTPWDISTGTNKTYARTNNFTINGSLTYNIELSHDGKKIAWAGSSTAKSIFISDLETPWEIANVVGRGIEKRSNFVSIYDLLGTKSLVSASMLHVPFKVRFSPGGKKAFILNSISAGYMLMVEVRCDKPYDLSTMYYQSFVDVADITSIGASKFLTSFDISSDGNKVFVLTNDANDNNHIEYFDLEIPWDINSYKSSVGVSTSNYYWFKQNATGTRRFNPYDLEFTPDGKSFFVCNIEPETRGIYEYSVETPYDISTAEPVLETLDLYSQISTSATYGIFMSRDGTKFFAITRSGTVFRYDIPELYAHNINKAVYNGITVSLSGQDSAHNGIYFKPDGAKMYTVGSTNDNVYEYSLSSAWDVSTRTLSNTFSVSGLETIPQDIKFSRDGDYMFICGNGNNNKTITSYKLNTPWDTTTAAFWVRSPIQQNFNISDFTSFDFSPDGYNLIIVDGANATNRIHQIKLTNPYQIDQFEEYVTTKSLYGVGSYNWSIISTIQSIFFSEDGNKLYLMTYYDSTYGGFVYTASLVTPFDARDIHLKGYLQDPGSSTAHSFCFSTDGLTLYTEFTTSGYVFKYRLREPYKIENPITNSAYREFVILPNYVTSIGKISITHDNEYLIVPNHYGNFPSILKYKINNITPLEIFKPVVINSRLNVGADAEVGSLTILSDEFNITPGIGTTASLGILYSDSKGRVKTGINPLNSTIYSSFPVGFGTTNPVGVVTTSYSLPSLERNIVSRVERGYLRGGILAPNGKIYMFDEGSGSALEIDPYTLKNRYIGRQNTYTDPEGDGNYFGVTLALDGKVYMIPYDNQNSVRVFDPYSGESEQVGMSSATNSASAYHSACLGRNGKIYAMPFNETRMLEYDPTTQQATYYHNWSGSSRFTTTVLGPNGKIYGIPYNTNYVAEFDPQTGISTQYTVGGTWNYWGAVLAPNGYIYAVPYNNTQVMKFNPENGDYGLIGDVYSGSGKWIGGSLAPNGRIYCTPYTGKSTILEIDPVTDTTAEVATVGTGYRGSILAPDGKIFAIPYNRNSKTGVIIQPQNIGIHTSGFVRGDDWIYSAYVNNSSS